MDIICKKICLRGFKSSEYNPLKWGLVTGLTSNNYIEYYTGQTNSNATLCSIPILITQNIDDMGVLTNVTDWSGDTINNSGVTVSFIGTPKINEFRRYSKKDNDVDLYNPIENSGYTQTINIGGGLVKKIKSGRSNLTGGKQMLYDYVIGATINDLNGTGIHYSDINSRQSIVTYVTSGLTSENSIVYPIIKNDYLLGIVEQPKIKNDVFIERGENSTYYKNLIFGDIRSFKDMESYGNGSLKLKEN